MDGDAYRRFRAEGQRFLFNLNKTVLEQSKITSVGNQHPPLIIVFLDKNTEDNEIATTELLKALKTQEYPMYIGFSQIGWSPVYQTQNFTQVSNGVRYGPPEKLVGIIAKVKKDMYPNRDLVFNTIRRVFELNNIDVGSNWCVRSKDATSHLSTSSDDDVVEFETVRSMFQMLKSRVSDTRINSPSPLVRTSSGCLASEESPVHSRCDSPAQEVST